MDIKILRATSDDLNFIKSIENSLESKILSQNALSIDLSNKNNYFFIAKSDDNIVGYIGASYMIDHIDILSVAIIDKYRNNGAATKLLNEIFLVSKVLNVNDIFLEVRTSNTPAICFYEKNGFKRINIRKNYYSSPNEDAYIYVKKLI